MSTPFTTLEPQQGDSQIILLQKLIYAVLAGGTGGGGGGGDASAANQVTGNATLANILAKLTNGVVPVNPGAVTSDNDKVQTNATGATFNALPNHTAKTCTVINTTGTAIDVQYGSGEFVTLPDQSGNTFRGLTNTNGLKVRRTDLSGTQVNVRFNYENW